MPPEGSVIRSEIDQVLARLRELQETIPPKDELLVALGVVSEAAGAYCDATFAKAMGTVHQVAARLPADRAQALRRSLHRAVQSFGGQETEFRRRAYQALALLSSIDPRAAGEARSLFESAVRAERLLVQASFDADQGNIAGLIRNLEEFADLLAPSGERARVKICLLGDGAVGKTSLIRRYVNDTFTDEYVETIGARVSNKQVTMHGPDGKRRVGVALWDIMGHELLGRLRQSYLMGADGAVLVVSVSDKKSADSLASWTRLLDQTVGKVPVVAVANKMDVRERRVKPRELEALAAESGCEVVGASARTGDNVGRAFDSIVRMAASGTHASARDRDKVASDDGSERHKG